MRNSECSYHRAVLSCLAIILVKLNNAFWLQASIQTTEYLLTFFHVSCTYFSVSQSLFQSSAHHKSVALWDFLIIKKLNIYSWSVPAFWPAKKRAREREEKKIPNKVCSFSVNPWLSYFLCNDETCLYTSIPLRFGSRRKKLFAVAAWLFLKGDLLKASVHRPPFYISPGVWIQSGHANHTIFFRTVSKGVRCLRKRSH